MDSELSEVVLRQVAGSVASKQHAIQVKRSQAIRRLQAWHYLIPVLTAFWMVFAIILIASGFLFLIVGLTILVLFSVLVTILAWAYQNNV